MSRVKHCFVGLLAYSSLLQAQAISPRDFAYGQLAVPVRDAAAYRFALSPNVYQNTVREDLGDLRVFNAEGVVVPFSLCPCSRSTRAPRSGSTECISPSIHPDLP